MIIAIDVGNTNIVVGCMQEENIRFTARMATDRCKTADEYAMMLMNLFALHKANLSDVHDGVISSVVPELKNTLSSALERLTGRAPLIVGSGVKTGVNIKIDFPAQLGSDRVVNAVAALAKYPRPIVIIDMGTATTLCVIDKQGSYLGGMIMPGPQLAVQALSSRTAQLPHIGFDAPEQVIGTNTISSMRAGVIYGNAAMLDGTVARIEEELGEPVTTVGTGGMMPTIVPYCKRKVIVDPNLTLTGLRLIYEKNRCRRKPAGSLGEDGGSSITA